MSKIKDIPTEEIMVPRLKVIRISEDAVIRLADHIYGTLYICPMSDEGVILDEFKIGEYSNESVLITVPKAWIGKQVMVKFNKKYLAKRVGSYINLPRIDLSDGTTIGDLSIDYAPKETAFYHIYKIEQ